MISVIAPSFPIGSFGPNGQITAFIDYSAPSCAALTRACTKGSNRLIIMMDCGVKPGNDKL